MATSQTEPPPSEPPPPTDYNKISNIFKRLLGKNSPPAPPLSSPKDVEEAGRDPSPSGGLLRRASRRVVPGLPRAKTFKRQQSEVRDRLEAIKPTQAERRAVSVDRRGQHPLSNVSSNQQNQHLPRASAPEFLNDTHSITTAGHTLSVPQSPVEEKQFLDVSHISTVAVDPPPPVEEPPLHVSIPAPGPPSTADAHSMTTSLYDAMIHDELERKWILNLSMHFRDKSKREKFFVTYRENKSLWRRVTISLDYRDAPEDSLEKDLIETKFQREKSAKIYEAIRDSLPDIQFYDTVTNLKLQTTDGRLHVHVVEDVNEIIHYPSVRMVQQLRCSRIRESDLEFDSHMSGFVYKVRVDGQTLIKKEIPGPDTVDEFLYEVNALNSLKFSQNVIRFYGVVVDDDDKHVKGLLIDYAEQGALIDIIYDSQEHDLPLPWVTREKWARQIVQGLSDIHEAGFVQGDFTLSNIVIDNDKNAKIIDINRRGCPVGWEPPEATPLINSSQRISMYIGVKSDLYQLGMVLWALATLEDEPEAHPRPLRLDPEIELPPWYRRMVESCLIENPRFRPQAFQLVAMFPEPTYDDDYGTQDPPSISVDDGYSVQRYVVEGYDRSRQPIIRSVTPQSDWYFSGNGHGSGLTSPGLSDDAFYYPPRGRSPPSPLPSNDDECDTPYISRNVLWSRNHVVGSPSASDYAPDGLPSEAIEDGLKAAVPASVEGSEGLQTSPPQDHAVDGQEVSGSQAVEPVSTDEVLPAHKSVVDEIKASPIRDEMNDAVYDDDLTPTGKLSESQRSGSVDSTAGNATLPQEPAGRTESASEPDKAAEAIGREEDHLSVPEVSGQQDDTGPNTDLGPVNLQQIKPASPTQSTEEVKLTSASDFQIQEKPSSLELPGELTGVGGAYDTQDDIKQEICCEDLGLVTTTSQNVTSQA